MVARIGVEVEAWRWTGACDAGGLAGLACGGDVVCVGVDARCWPVEGGRCPRRMASGWMGCGRGGRIGVEHEAWPVDGW